MRTGWNHALKLGRCAGATGYAQALDEVGPTVGLLVATVYQSA
jgi:hypothetical protein